MGLDIRDLGTSLSYRRLGVILDNSPADSAFAWARDGEQTLWGVGDHLLALVADRLGTVSWQLQGDPKAMRPKPVYRPGSVDESRTKGTALPLAHVKALFAKRDEEARCLEPTSEPDT
jgi:hypothetical protein